VKIPNAKTQTPKKIQISTLRDLDFGCRIKFEISLAFERWRLGFGGTLP
jgi:hypothetical protein